jgi:hypothetical protein
MDTTTWACPECNKEITEPKRRGPHLSSCRRSLKAKYKYIDGDTKHPCEWKACETCKLESWIQVRHQFCSVKCSRIKENNPQWKGENAVSCVWGCEHTRYEWANLTGNHDDPDDYAQMCSECHARYDGAITKCFDKTCKRGHMLNNDTMYVKIRNGKEVRQCKQCAKDRAKERRMR